MRKKRTTQVEVAVETKPPLLQRLERFLDGRAALFLLALGLWRRPERPPGAWPFAILAAIPIAILAVALPARINIGVRHILPAFPFFALIAASGALWLIRLGSNKSWAGWAAAAVILWLCVSFLAAHPDYLTYFNAFAGSEPERIVVESDLDWGQDIKRLGKRLKELNASSVAFSPSIMIDPPRYGIPPWRWKRHRCSVSRVEAVQDGPAATGAWHESLARPHEAD